MGIKKLSLTGTLVRGHTKGQAQPGRGESRILINIDMSESQNCFKYAAYFCFRKYGLHTFMAQISYTNYNG